MNASLPALLLGLSVVVLPAGSMAQSADAVASPAPIVDDAALPPALARVHPAWRDFEPTWRTEPCPFAPRTEFDKQRIECGFVLVPENRRDPDSRLIRLSAARVAADGEDPPAGTSVYLQGGPGGPAMQIAPALLASSSERAARMREVSHWVFPDYRGIGFSEPYFCRGLYLDMADEAPFSAEGRERINADMRDCLDRARARGIDTRAYTTWDGAMDIRDLRRALGLAEWNLMGISYGTEMGQMVLRVDEPGTRAAVLDSVVAPPPASWERYSEGMESALAALDRACKEHGACARRFGDLEPLAREAVEAYRAAPQTVEDVDPYIAPDGTLVLNHRLSARGLFLALYSREVYAVLPAMFEAWTAGDPMQMRAYVEQLAGGWAAGPDWGHGYQFMANCTGSALIDTESRVGSGRPGDAADFWREALSDGYFSDSCRALGLSAPDPLYTPVETDVPVLVLAGTVDPITPPTFARAILPGLDNAVYVEVPYTGHGATGVPCAARIMGEFLTDPTARPDTACLDDMRPPDFVTGYKATGGPLGLVGDARDGRYGALAWGAVPMFVLLVAVFAFPLAAVGRRVDRTGVAARGPRLLAWLAALLGVVGVVLLGLAFQQTVATSPALVPLGLIGPTGWATAALVLALLAAAAALWFLRGGERSLGTTVGAGLTALSVVLVFAFTVHRELVF